MLDVDHTDDDSVWCYNDGYHWFFLQPENSLLLHHIIHQFIHKNTGSLQDILT